MTVVEPRKPVALLAVFAAIGPALVAPVAATPVADAQPVVRDCPGNNYVTLYTNFDELRSYLNGKYRKKGRVWQAPNDEAVWRLWCGATHGSAILNGSNAIPNRITLNDWDAREFSAGKYLWWLHYRHKQLEPF